MNLETVYRGCLPFCQFRMTLEIKSIYHYIFSKNLDCIHNHLIDENCHAGYCMLYLMGKGHIYIYIYILINLSICRTLYPLCNADDYPNC